jgi:hypothetical protein
MARDRRLPTDSRDWCHPSSERVISSSHSTPARAKKKHRLKAGFDRRFHADAGGPDRDRIPRLVRPHDRLPCHASHYWRRRVTVFLYRRPRQRYVHAAADQKGVIYKTTYVPDPSAKILTVAGTRGLLIRPRTSAHLLLPSADHTPRGVGTAAAARQTRPSNAACAIPAIPGNGSAARSRG